MIEFLEEPHLYLKNGILVNSVTQILQLIFPDKYKGINKIEYLFFKKIKVKTV